MADNHYVPGMFSNDSDDDIIKAAEEHASSTQEDIDATCEYSPTELEDAQVKIDADISASAGSYAGKRIEPGPLKDILPSEPIDTVTYVPADSFVVSEDELGEVLQDAPRPVTMNAQNTASFETLHGDTGVVLHTRESAAQAAEIARNTMRATKRRMRRTSRPEFSRHASEDVPGKKKNIKLILGGVAVVAIITVAIVFFTGLGGKKQDNVQDPEASLNTLQADLATGIEVAGSKYSIVQAEEGGKYSLQKGKSSEETSTQIFELEGTPLAIVFYNGTFLIPENLDGKWKVVSWTDAEGSEPSTMIGSDEKGAEGEGQISTCSLDGSTFTLTFADETTISYSL